jgi:transcriptional regulator with PAS, ATPase and Fis domain
VAPGVKRGFSLHRVKTTPHTRLVELQARVKAAQSSAQNTGPMVRSIQQSMRVEGYNVSAATVRAAVLGNKLDGHQEQGCNSPMRRLAALLHSDDLELQRMGRDELIAALEAHGGVRQTAYGLHIPERTLWRWIKAHCIAPPDERRVAITDEQIRAAIRKRKSALGAAEELGVSHTTIQRRARAAGIELPDGRVTRHLTTGGSRGIREK